MDETGFEPDVECVRSFGSKFLKTKSFCYCPFTFFKKTKNHNLSLKKDLQFINYKTPSRLFSYYYKTILTLWSTLNQAPIRMRVIIAYGFIVLRYLLFCCLVVLAFKSYFFGDVIKKLVKSFIQNTFSLWFCWESDCV